MGQPANTIRITASTRKGIAVEIDSRAAGSTNPAMQTKSQGPGYRELAEGRQDAQGYRAGLHQ
eukprot:5285443-Amphidinium_carterae.1